jgi:hypothetical protein
VHKQPEQTIADDGVLRRCEEEDLVGGADDWELFLIISGRTANISESSG